MQETSVLIIGAGQQGLALGKKLKDAGVPFLILERQESVGAHWKGHYDSLVLFTPRRFSALPGLSLSGAPDGYATKDEFAAYLSTYAKHFDLPVVLQAPVGKLRKEAEWFVAETPQGTFRARQAVVATGGGRSFIPFASYAGFSLHSSLYKNSAQIPGTRVLVVGGGNSGAQIATELSVTHVVDIALSGPIRTIAPTTLGKSFYWWMQLFGFHRVRVDSFFGRLIRKDKDFVVGSELVRSIRDGQVGKRPAVAGVDGASVAFSDGTHASYDAVVWATGFRSDYSWIAIPEAFDADGRLSAPRGVSSVPGLYFSGLRNQLSIVSSNIYGAAENAEFIARAIRERA